MATIVSRESIESEARAAADAGQTPAYACSWPFTTPEGQYWLQVYREAKGQPA